MRGFPSRGRSHIENTLVGLRGESNDRKKGGGGLEHVVAGEVFGRGACNGVRAKIRHVGTCEVTYRNATFENLKANVCPFTNRFKIDATVNQGLSEVSPPRPEGVGTNCYRSRDFIGFEELNSLREKRQ